MVAQWPGRLLDIPRIPQDSSGILAFPAWFPWLFLAFPEDSCRES